MKAAANKQITIFSRNHKAEINRIYQVYGKVGIRIQPTEKKEKIKSIDFKERFLDAQKIYDHDKGQKKIRKIYQTATSNKQQKGAFFSLEKKQKTHETVAQRQKKAQDLNLYSSEGRRKTIYERLMQNSHSDKKSNKAIRVRSAAFLNKQQTSQLTYYSKLGTPKQLKSQKLDNYSSRAVRSKLRTATIQRDTRDNFEEREMTVRKKNRSQIIIFEQGILLRNKF